MNFCSQCGAAIGSPARFCQNCGKPIASPTDNQSIVVPGRPRRKRSWPRVLRHVFVYGTVFVLGLIIGAAIVLDGGQKSSETRAIAAVLDADAGIFALADSTQADRMSMIAAYIEGVRAIDTSSCPGDFQEAYFRHVKAWENYHAALATKSTEQMNALVAFLASLVIGGGATGLSALEPMLAADPSFGAVADSWTEVQAAAIRHGVVFEQ